MVEPSFKRENGQIMDSYMRMPSKLFRKLFYALARPNGIMGKCSEMPLNIRQKKR